MDFNLTEDQRMLQTMVKDFTQKEIEPRATEMDRNPWIPDDLLKRFTDVGLLGMTVPKEYGGTEAGGFAHFLAIEQLAYAGTPAWWLAAFNNSVPETICHWGTPEQKEKYVKGQFDGTKCFSVQFTEPETGSDPTALITTSRPDGDYYIINGQKRFSTFGARNGTAIVWTKDETDACTCFLINKNDSGYTAPKIWDLMGTGGIEAADVYYENFRVHNDQTLGEKGKGLMYYCTG